MSDGDDELDSFLERVAGVPSAPPPGFAPLRTGERFGRYEILGTLGAGGMGRVYAARRAADGARVALKVIKPGAMARPEARARFEREARAILELRHPAIVPGLDFGEVRGLPFLVMPRLEGRVLRERLSDEGRLALEEVRRLVGPIVDALATAHAQGVVHRDLKPENVWLEPVGDAERARLLDFGLARVLGQPGLTDTGASFGTPTYMSPEQLRSAKRAGPAADQYALAVVVYEALSGRVPFAGRDTIELVLAKATDPVPPIDAPRRVNEALARALAADPAARFEDVRAFGAAL